MNLGASPPPIVRGRDTAVFRTTIPPEPTRGAVGWAVADALRDRLRTRGVIVWDARPWYDGLKLPCRSGRTMFWLELTPVFEVEPMKWFISVHTTGFWRFVVPVSRRDRERLCDTLESVFAQDDRFTLVEWLSVRGRSLGKFTGADAS